MEVNDYSENYTTGWIKVYRSISQHWLWQDKPFTKGQAWIDILMECNHAEKKVNIKNDIIICERGESLNSLETWAKRWGWDKSRVRRFIKLLETDTMVVLKSTQQSTHLKVINYSIYNDNRNGKRNTDETQMKRKRNAVDTKQEVKNEKNEKNIYKPNFEAVWLKYPSKVKRKESEKHFYSTVKTEKDFDTINRALDNYKNHLAANDWKKPQNGSTWFNNWRDWIDCEEPGLQPPRKAYFD